MIHIVKSFRVVNEAEVDVFLKFPCSLHDPTNVNNLISAIRVISSAYLIFLPAVLIPACESSSPAFLMMYSVEMLNKQGDNIQPCCNPFPILNQSVVAYLVLTIAS